MTLLSIKHVIARKPHNCDWCNEEIPAGEVYQRSGNKYDGEVYTWKNHIHCQRIAQEMDMWSEYDDAGGLSADGFSQSIQDAYCTIMSDEHNKLYESEEFEMPDFKGQLKFVLDSYKIQHTL